MRQKVRLERMAFGCRGDWAASIVPSSIFCRAAASRLKNRPKDHKPKEQISDENYLVWTRNVLDRSG